MALALLSATLLAAAQPGQPALRRPAEPHTGLGAGDPPPRVPEPLWTSRKPTPAACPWKSVAAELNATGGRLSVRLFDTIFPNHAATDDGPAINWAINASHVCGGVVFFDAGEYSVSSPIDVPSDTVLMGGGGRGSDQFQTGPEGAAIFGPAVGPVFQTRGAQKIRFENLEIIGKMTGVSVSGGALIRFVNCAIHAQMLGTGPDAVNTSAAGCSGCNVVLNSSNTALVVENTFWLWVEDSSFFFYPLYGTCAATPPTKCREYWGQRPSVILRGTDSNIGGGGVNSVYLVYFARVIFEGGGVQYQQLAPSNQWPGYFDFYCALSAHRSAQPRPDPARLLTDTQTENSATPLLDVQVAPGLSGTMGVQAVTITGYRPDDTVAPNYLSGYPALVPPGTTAPHNGGLVPVVALNCSGAPGCHLDGVTISSAGQYGGATSKPAPAIRVFSGQVNSVTVLSSQLTGSVDVLDAENRPVGSWISRSAGGFVFVGDAPTAATSRAGEAALTAGGRNGGGTNAHAALVGLAGEANARFALSNDGTMHWGDGASDTFHTNLRAVESGSASLPAMEIPARGAKASTIPLAVNASASSNRTGTLATCEAAHESLDEENLDLEISCRVSKAADAALLVVRNHGGDVATLDAGRALVVLRRYAA